MKRKLVRLSVLGLAGASVIMMNSAFMHATRIAGEQPMAGITLSMDKYYELIANDGNSGIVKTSFTVPEPEGLTVPAEETDTSMTATNPIEETDEVSQEEKERSIKEMISNMNYDRLGIAKVSDWLNIREKPGTDSKVVGKLPKNAGCHIYEIDEDGWAKIISNHVSGYVKAEYLITDEEAEEYALEVGKKVVTVNTETLRARFAPSTDAAVYNVLGMGEDFEIVKENLTQSYMKNFIEKNLDGEDAHLISNVDVDSMMGQLEDWICIDVDNDKVFVSKEFVQISYQLKKAVAIKELATDGSSGVSSLRARMVQFAMQYLGNRYVFGGTSLTGGIDCSAFIMRIYQNFGYSIPRSSYAQAQYARSISGSEVKPGDLFFYERGGRIGHVAMYIGNGQIIHASSSRTGIIISNAYYKHPLKIGRIIND